MAVIDDIRSDLAELERTGLLRRPRAISDASGPHAVIGGARVVVFCSNDYLGLSHHPELIQTFQTALARYGVGAGASRLITGTHEAHLRTEERLAALVGQPASLLFSTGYAANLGALSSLLDRGDVAFSDRLNHASLIDGLRLSRARVHVFPHADPDALAASMEAHRADGRRAWVVTDAVFSMDGDAAPLRAYRELCDRYDAGLFVDEAHALGVVGRGRGLCDHLAVRPDALVGTLGKAAGLAGAFVAGPAELRTLLENRARSYVFSTAPPAAQAEAVRVAADLVEAASTARQRLQGYGRELRKRLRAAGWEVPDGESPIVPIRIGEPRRTMRLSAELLERGLFVQGIRPPTVPEGGSRLRVVPTAAHSPEEIEALVEALAGLRHR